MERLPARPRNETYRAGGSPAEALPAIGTSPGTKHFHVVVRQFVRYRPQQQQMKHKNFLPVSKDVLGTSSSPSMVTGDPGRQGP